MEVRNLDRTDLDAALDIRTRSFGVLPEPRRDGWRRMMQRSLAENRALGCYDGKQLVAMARINHFRQWWCGRSLPLAGIGGVVVTPEHRGRGVGQLLMLGILQRAAGQGFPLSALYPTTLPLYRSCGWEIAGAQYLVTVPAEALRGLSTAQVPLRRVGPNDAAEILSVVGAIHTAARTSGPFQWQEPEVRSWLLDDAPFTYLTEDGFLAYHWDGHDLEVDELVAGSGETARALWSLVGSGSSVATSVTACLGPNDPLRWLTQETAVRPVGEKRWMLRLVDVATALTDRGYPAGIDAEVTLAVDDPQRPDNTDTWRLTVAKGSGQAERTPARAGNLRLGPRGLAALYAGTPLSTLRTTGLVADGDPVTDALLDAIFAAQPYLLDYF